MKKIFNIVFTVLTFIAFSCNEEGVKTEVTAGVSETVVDGGGQASVKDDESAKDVVKIAAGSRDHTTTTAAFDNVPKETLENLMKEENKAQLQDILQYHVYVGNLKTEMMTDGQTLNQVNGGNITVAIKDGKVVINNAATVVTSIPASNGIIHIIDGVLLPPSK